MQRPQSPEFTVRYQGEEQAHKNRILALNQTIVPVFNQYVEQYKPQDFLFDCTPRNLEYVLDEVGQKAGIRSVQEFDGYIARCKAHYWGVSQQTRFLHWLIDREYRQCRRLD